MASVKTDNSPHDNLLWGDLGFCAAGLRVPAQHSAPTGQEVIENSEPDRNPAAVNSETGDSVTPLSPPEEERFKGEHVQWSPLARRHPSVLLSVTIAVISGIAALQTQQAAVCKPSTFMF